jgi:hypothetical protein
MSSTRPSSGLGFDWLPEWWGTRTSAAEPSDESANSPVRPEDHVPEDTSRTHELRDAGGHQNTFNSRQNGTIDTQPAKDHNIINNSGQNGVPIQPAGDEPFESIPLDNLNHNGIAIEPAPEAIVIAVDPDRDRSVKRRLRGIHLFVCTKQIWRFVF